LAVFNSCISLGAASDLQSAGVPMVVATRHKMHNFIAPEFLEYFLDAYIKSDKSIKDAVWYARERLKTDTPYFPCANWLPVIFQIPTVISQPKPSPLVAIATSFVVTLLVISIHALGLFQSAELDLYDHMMNKRAEKPLDQRIVVIHIDKQDQEWQESRGAKLGHESIDNEHLAQLLKRLDEENPKAIGITLARKNPKNNTDENQVFIDNRMLNDRFPTLIANCSFDTGGSSDSAERGYFPEVMRVRDTRNEDLYPYGDPRIGFTNIAVDSKYKGTARRLLLMQNLPNNECGEKAWISFPLRIVFAALDIKDNEIEVNAPNDRFFLKFNNIKISNIVKGQGGYQVDPSLSGDDLAKNLSILFNFRNNISNVAPLSLRSILTRKNISLRDKIVVIGGIGKDVNENINNIYFHTLAINYLLQVFEGGSVLKGVDNDVYYFIYCYLQILLINLLLLYLCNNFKYNNFPIYFFIIITASLTVAFINFNVLDNFAIWIPSIPILFGILTSSVIVSIYYQKSDSFIYNN
jgi:CHASE2 domain-containing sensor protein